MIYDIAEKKAEAFQDGVAEGTQQKAVEAAIKVTSTAWEIKPFFFIFLTFFSKNVSKMAYQIYFIGRGFYGKTKISAQEVLTYG